MKNIKALALFTSDSCKTMNVAKAKAIDHKAKVKAKVTFFLASRLRCLEVLISLELNIIVHNYDV